MFDFILKLLTPKDANGNVLPIIGYFLQSGKKKLALVKSFAIKSEVFGLEVVIGETRRQKQTNGGNQHLNEFQTRVYLTQHDSAQATIEEAVDLFYDCDEFYDQEVVWPEIPNGQANVRRAVVILNHRCRCPDLMSITG